MSGGLGLLILFLAVSGGSFVALQWLQNRRSTLDRRREAARLEGVEQDEPGLLLGDMTEALAGQVPLTEEALEELRPEMREAGYYRPTILMEFAAIRALFIILPLLFAVTAALLVPRQLIPTALGFGVLFAGLGYAMPRIYIHQVARARKRQIERGLPVAVDMMALAMTAGQTLYAALTRVAQEVQPAFPELARELDIVRRHAHLRSLDFALRDWADRVRIPEVNQLVSVLTSSELLGKDVSTGLLEFAEHYRMTQRQRADAQANRASVLMLFPMLLGMWIPAAVILVMPIIFEFQNRGQQAMKEMEKGAELRERQMKLLERRTQPQPPAPAPEGQ